MSPDKVRLYYNGLVEKYAQGKVLDVGKSGHWDYGFETIDVNKRIQPDIIGDICDSNLPDRVYDTVLCNGMYEFVSDPQKMVDEVRRITKVGGIAIFGFVGKNYKPYRKKWKYYKGDIDFRMNVIEKKDFDNYHFVICERI
jgi:SAM-dependent methyltransferase